MVFVSITKHLRGLSFITGAVLKLCSVGSVSGLPWCVLGVLFGISRWGFLDRDSLKLDVPLFVARVCSYYQNARASTLR